jgi:hypothetical protein
MMVNLSPLERLGNELFGALPKGRGRSALKRALRVRRIWAEAVGESLSRELHPGKVEGDCLWISTASSTWLGEARFLEVEILRALEKADPELGIRRTRIRLDSSSPRALPGILLAPTSPFRRLVAPEEQERIRDMVRGVRDEVLRDRLARLFEKVAARTRVEGPEEPHE